MKFIIEYGCDITTEHLAIEADSLADAEQYAYQSAYDCRESYEGFHGVLDFSEYCEEEGYDEDNDYAWDSYSEMVENELHYCVELFDESDENHLIILNDDCNGEFYKI